MIWSIIVTKNARFSLVEGGATTRTSRVSRTGRGARSARNNVTDLKAEFERNYRESFSLVYNYIFRYVGNAADAQDITADTFLRAARYFDRFDPSRAKFSTWVISIARNCMNSHFRRERPTTDIDDISEGLYASDEDPEALVVDTPEEGSVGKLLEVLDDESRELVFKKYYEQKSNKQIALEMDMNASTVSTKLSRAMAKMRTVAQREGL